MHVVCLDPEPVDKLWTANDRVLGLRRHRSGVTLNVLSSPLPGTFSYHRARLLYL